MRIWPSNTESVEDLGFYLGSQELPEDPAQERINANIDRQIAKERRDAAPTLRRLEASKFALELRSADAEASWKRVRQHTAGVPPAVVAPLVLLVVAGVIFISEVLLLAPALDGLGMGSRIWQTVTATGLVAVSAWAVHASLDLAGHLNGAHDADQE